MLFTAAEMCQLVNISKDPKIHNLFKDSSGLYVLPPRTIKPEPPQLNRAEPRNMPRRCPCHQGKADRISKASGEEEERERKAKAPRATDIHTGVLLLLSWLFIAWCCGHDSIRVISAEVHYEWKVLDEACLLLCKIGMF